MSSAKFKLTVNLDRATINSLIEGASRKGTWMALDHLATVSKQQVPLDQGPLQNSCYVDVSQDGSEGTVSYDTPYAIKQHEVMTYHHQRGRKAKYLEDPCNDSGVQAEMLELARRGMADEMGG